MRAGALEPALYIVSTPIGNLEDITLRALKVLAGADVIACEDTRTTAKLLRRYQIAAKTIAYHEHNGEKMRPKLLAMLAEGRRVALVSDAGTPLISDPGFMLVKAAMAQSIKVVAIPGPSAALAALVVSGQPSDAWMFCGFLPAKAGPREKRLRRLADARASLVFYESPRRTAAMLAAMADVFSPGRPVSICRELTKLHEEVITGSLGEVAAAVVGRELKGEVVIVVGPPAQDALEDAETLLLELLQSNSVSAAAGEAARLTGRSKRELYRQALALAGKRPGS